MAAPGPGMPNGVGRTGGITEDPDDPLSPSMRSKLRAASSFLGETNGEASKPTPKPTPKLKYAFLERPERKLAFPNRLQEHFLQTIWVSLSEDMPSVIVAYNTAQFTMLGTLFTYNGTILDSPFSWLQAGFLQILAWGLVGFFYALDVDTDNLKTKNITDAIVLINAVLAFSLGLYVSLSINRWWEMRGSIGAVIGATANLTWYASLFCPSVDDPITLNLKRRVMRYGTASVALLFVEDNRLEKAQERGLLTKVEMAQLKGKGSPPMLLWLWIGLLIQRAVAEEIIFPDIKFLLKIMMRIRDARDMIQRVTTFTNVQLPLPYVHVIIAITKLVFFMLTFQGGCKMFISLKNGDYLALIMEVLVLAVMPMIYQGLIDLTEKISNPFGGDEIDFPGEAYQKALLGQCNEFIAAAAAPPDWEPQVPDVFNFRGSNSNADKAAYAGSSEGLGTRMEPRIVDADFEYAQLPPLALELEDIFVSDENRAGKRKTTKGRVKSAVPAVKS